MLLNMLCCIPVLLWKAIEIYVIPTFALLVKRTANFFRNCLCCWSVYTDTSFEGPHALGKEVTADNVEWLRAHELKRNPSSGPPREQDMTPTRAAGALAYTCSFICTIYMGILEVFDLSWIGAQDHPPPPPLLSSLSPPSPSFAPLLPPWSPSLSEIGSGSGIYLIPSPPPPSDPIQGQYHMGFGFSLLGTILCGTTLICGRTASEGSRVTMALGYAVAALCMALAFLWFAPGDGDGVDERYAFEWGTGVNVLAFVCSLFAAIDTAYTALFRCPSVPQLVIGLCCGSCSETLVQKMAPRLRRRMHLYEGGIEPDDLCQGQIGDCWLIAALASAAEHPAAIRNVFISREYNPRGKYKVRLFHPGEKQWKVITIDDRMPCQSGTKQPLFIKQVGDELWAQLLEKAFAKLCGSYSHLAGGFVPWGWRVLTGDTVFQVKCIDDGSWERLNIECGIGADGTMVQMFRTGEKFTSEQLWHIVLKYLDAKCILGAGGVRNDDSSAGGAGLNGENVNKERGLVEGHAYSILEARELGLIPGLGIGGGLLGQVKLLKLRNPWGAFEWKGAWSKHAKEWDTNPIVRAALRPKEEEDGSFWMPWDEFRKTFQRVDFCDRTTKFDLALEVAEDMGPGGLFWGCINGLARFFCCCQGLMVIYFGRSSTAETKSSRLGAREFFCALFKGCRCRRSDKQDLRV